MYVRTFDLDRVVKMRCVVGEKISTRYYKQPYISLYEGDHDMSPPPSPAGSSVEMNHGLLAAMRETDFDTSDSACSESLKSLISSGAKRGASRILRVLFREDHSLFVHATI